MLAILSLSVLSLLTHTNAQANTNIDCSPVTPIDVPRDQSLYWGTWYSISTCTNCTDPTETVCSQVGINPTNPSSKSSNAIYTASFNELQPKGPVKQVFGDLTPIDLEGFNPLYFFALNISNFTSKNNFWIIATGGDGTTISAMVIMTCTASGNTDQQLFFLSREPYFVPPVTFASLESKVKRAINNYDKFEILGSVHSQGWCAYDLPTTFQPTATTSLDCPGDDTTSIDIASGASVAASVFTATIFSVLVFVLFIKK